MDRPRTVDIDGGLGAVDVPVWRPTPAMIADALRRNAAPRPLTAWLMGDPAPGQSALDQRRAATG